MRFQLLTLVDITKTDARRGDQTVSYKQQQNFFSVLQTISLRANPVVDSSPVAERQSTKGLGFGSNFAGEHMIWCLPFVFETASSHSIEFLKQDFNMVPFIAGLAETAKFKELAFCTNDPKKTNIVFVQLEE